MMFAEAVFVAFDVFVEEASFSVDRECGHLEREDLPRGGKGLACRSGLHCPCQRQTVELAVAREDAALRVFLDIGSEVQGAVGRHRERSLPAAEGGKTQRRAAIGRNGPDILAALAPGGKDYILSVGAPHRFGVVGRVAGELPGFAASCGYDEKVALIHENYLGSVGGNCVLAEPAGSGLCRGCDCQHCGEDGRKNSHIANIRNN